MIGNYIREWWRTWNQFWFVPRSAEILALMRILVGSMLLYSHAVWTIDLEAFMAADGALSPSLRASFDGSQSFAWSHFDWSESATWLWTSHFIALLVWLMFTLGICSRITSIVSFLLVVSYANRATGALFGLDQINAFLTLYLAIGNCGQRYSVDSWLGRSIRKTPGQGRAVRSSVSNTIATRLIQLHMCTVYLFAGLGKLQGDSWWNGEAIWGTIASYEYQTLDLTWMAGCMWLVNILTYLTVAWEISYPFLVWPRLTRPLVLGIALVVHLGIGLSMGMMTFGLIMLYGNLAFIPPQMLTGDGSFALEAEC